MNLHFPKVLSKLLCRLCLNHFPPAVPPLTSAGQCAHAIQKWCHMIKQQTQFTLAVLQISHMLKCNIQGQIFIQAASLCHQVILNPSPRSSNSVLSMPFSPCFLFTLPGLPLVPSSI